MAKKEFLTLEEASVWASSYLGRRVTVSNISYLVQYGKVPRYDENGNPKTSSSGVTTISLQELKRYYDTVRKEKAWKARLGENINWDLSFDNVKESERTKHVHRLHPYKGKFIPQLVQYFLNGHVNKFKKEVFFHEGDVILDPFVGSGTTLVQCLELGLHSIGVDVSPFNCLISQVKIQKYDLHKLEEELFKAASLTEQYSESRFRRNRETYIDSLFSSLNGKYYPTPEFRILVRLMHEYQYKMVRQIKILARGDKRNARAFAETELERHKDETASLEKEIERLLARNSVKIKFRVSPDNVTRLTNDFTTKYTDTVLKQLDERTENILRARQGKLFSEGKGPFADSRFLSTWFNERQRIEMRYYLDQIARQEDPKIRNMMKIVLSRTARSCRATTHVDLATLIEPQSAPYYCTKHFRICRPLETIIGHLMRYTKDTIKRIREFSQLRKDVFSEVIKDDSRTVDLFRSIQETNPEFHEILEKNKIDGVFTSPPYVGQIDYHEQHAYAYELFGIDRRDTLEIGRMSNGAGRKAQSQYVDGISAVLLNVRKYMRPSAHVLVVANDSYDLYPGIAEASGLDIVEEFKRPVLNRTERDKQPYSESIFHMVFK